MQSQNPAAGLKLKEEQGQCSEQYRLQGRVARKGRTFDHPTEQWDGSLLAPNCSTKASLRETDRNLS